MYGLFIITRNRPQILIETIRVIQKQTLPPQTILVVDNSDNSDTENMLFALNDNKLQYHKMGYNAGPAGGAIIGMNTLFKQGFEWVVWGDDDDPPQFDNVIENLFNVVPRISIQTIGIIGAVGVKFLPQKAKTLRVQDDNLIGVVEVDNVAGGMMPLIHRNVFNNNVLPDASLFFGFEELDFCLSVKRAGLKIVVSGEEMLRHRQLFGRIGMARTAYKVKNKNALWREYYSTRNLLHILLRKEKSPMGVIALTLRSFAKMIYGFRFVFDYGKRNFYYLGKGISDGYLKNMGMTVVPMNKINS